MKFRSHRRSLTVNIKKEMLNILEIHTFCLSGKEPTYDIVSEFLSLPEGTYSETVLSELY